jgi:integrase
MKISDTWLQNVKPLEKKSFDVTVTNRAGLMVRIQPSGVITFRFRYKRKGKTFVVVLGAYGRAGLSLKRACEIHDLMRSELEQNLDPIEERQKRTRAQEEARDEGGTVAHMVDQFMHRRICAERWDDKLGWVRDPKSTIRPRKRPEKAMEMLRPTLIKKIGGQKAADVTKRQLVKLLDEIVDRGSPVFANRTYGIFKQCFAWAAAKDIIPASPMAGVEKPGGTETSRDRVLTPDEIRTFWSRLDHIRAKPRMKLALKILLVVPVRSGELRLAAWNEIDFDAGTWYIPKENSKTDVPNFLPLSDLALQLFKDLHALTGKSKYVLPHHKKFKNPDACCEESALTQAVYRNREVFGLTVFKPHDLRRTGATGMASLKIPRLHIEKVLNHKIGDVAEVYDRHDYFEQKRDALKQWGEHLQRILDNLDSNVVPFRKALPAAAGIGPNEQLSKAAV